MDDVTQAADIEEAPAHLAPEAARAYVDARMQGLCHEGALEIAEGVQEALRKSPAPAPGGGGDPAR